MMLYKNMEAMVQSPDCDTGVFYIVARIWQEDTLEPFVFIVCVDYVQQIKIDRIKKWFHTNKRQEADNISQKLSLM